MLIFSPVQQMIHPDLENEQHISFFIKRDDLIHPLVSGNKWRKLKYHIEKLRQLEKSILVTFGGAFSNHLLATASAGAFLGIETVAFVRGEEIENDTLFLCKLHGMKLIFVDRDSYRNKHELYQQYFGENAKAYYVPEGGGGDEGTFGCEEIVEELNENFTHIFCAAGTGTTAIGLVNGVKKKVLTTKINIVPVLKNFEYHPFFQKSDTQQYFTFHANYHFGGYAKTTQELLTFTQQFITKTGIVIDPVYTAKAMFAMIDLKKRGYFKPKDKVLFLHTGGILGVLGMKKKF